VFGDIFVKSCDDRVIPLSYPTRGLHKQVKLFEL